MDIPVEARNFYQKHKHFFRAAFTLQGALIGLGSVLIVVGAVAAAYLSTNNQDIRQQASTLAEQNALIGPSLGTPAPTLPPQFVNVVGPSGGTCYCQDTSGLNHVCDLSFCCTSQFPSFNKTAACTAPLRPTPTPTPLPNLKDGDRGTYVGPVSANGPCYCVNAAGLNYQCGNQNLCCQNGLYQSHHPECNAPSAATNPSPTPQPASTSLPVSTPGLSTVPLVSTCTGVCQAGSCSVRDQVSGTGTCADHQFPYCCVGGGSTGINALSDATHCGASGVACASGQLCINGTCITTVPLTPNTSTCQSDATQTCSTGWTSDPHCSMGHACAGTITAPSSAQVLKCYGPSDGCASSYPCDSTFVYVDQHSCYAQLTLNAVPTPTPLPVPPCSGICQAGSCSNQDQTLGSGTCTSSDKPYCCVGGGNTGINTRTDTNNCGAIGNICPNGQTCEASQCVVANVCVGSCLTESCKSAGQPPGSGTCAGGQFCCAGGNTSPTSDYENMIATLCADNLLPAFLCPPKQDTYSAACFGSCSDCNAT